MQEKLLILRKRHKYSQKFMADYLGISETQYGKKERGHYPFTSDEMFQISALFGKNIEDIFLPRSHRNGNKINV